MVRAGCSGSGSPMRTPSGISSMRPRTSRSSPRADPMPYGPHAADDRARMLETIGIDSVDALFEDIPEGLRSGPLHLDEPEPELLLSGRLQALAGRNRVDLA